MDQRKRNLQECGLLTTKSDSEGGNEEEDVVEDEVVKRKRGMIMRQSCGRIVCLPR